MIKIETYIVPTLETKIRLQDYVPGIFRTIKTKSGMKKAIKNGLVKINEQLAYGADYLTGGETIDLYENHEAKNYPEIEVKFEVLYEDDYLAVVNKPAGITVSGNKKWTLENALSGNLKKSTQIDALYRPEPIHRLDHPTSGVLLTGKTASVVTALNKLFEERKVEKMYNAVTVGVMPQVGVISIEIDKKSAKTEYEVRSKLVSARFGYLNLVELKPYSGRKHQLRKHLSEIGNPILGDIEYGIKGLILLGNGLYLHALSLEFQHPVTNKKISITAPLPKKFTRIFK